MSMSAMAGRRLTAFRTPDQKLDISYRFPEITFVKEV